MGRSSAVLALVSFALLSSCTKKKEAPTPPSSAAVPLAASALPTDKRATTTTVADFVSSFDDCALSHRGVLLDLGDPTMRAHVTGAQQKPATFEVKEREGASWASLNERSIELSFIAPIETKNDLGLVVEARVRGGAAKTLPLYLNGKLLGSLPLTKGETKVVSLRAPTATLARGANELMVRVAGAPRATKDNLVEIDWIRIGPADGEAPYAAPTRADALASVAIGGVARRGISLRAPGSARCSGFIPNGAALEGHVGVTGGEAEAEVRLLVDRAEPHVVGTFHLGAEGAAPWQRMTLPLGDVATLASVELVVKSSTKGARVVFAEPRVVVPSPPPADKLPRARGVILVVLGSAAPKSLSPYGGSIPTPELAQLAATGGSIFESHRASSSFANASVASMLTGLGPRAHGVSQPETALASSVVSVAEAARQGGIVTAMFTANPTTSAPYGFARGWETFSSRSPASDATATSIFEDVEHWLDGHKDQKFFILIHARGGHPPWDITAEELKDLPPAGYSGSLDPRHAGEMLAKVRKAGMARHFTDGDRERALALHTKALTAHDAALGRLVAHVRMLGRDVDTTWIVTGDVGVDAAAHAPFIDDETLDETALAVPLVMRMPGAPMRPRVTSSTSTMDLAHTALDALGLAPPPQMRGTSLWPLAQRALDGGAFERPRLATTSTRFSARWGAFVLSGARDRDGKLCNLALEPSCVTDVRATHPLAASMLHTVVFDDLHAGRIAGVSTSSSAGGSGESSGGATPGGGVAAAAMAAAGGSPPVGRGTTSGGAGSAGGNANAASGGGVSGGGVSGGGVSGGGASGTAGLASGAASGVGGGAMSGAAGIAGAGGAASGAAGGAGTMLGGHATPARVTPDAPTGAALRAWGIVTR